MSVVVVHEAASAERRIDRALRALRVSGRRLMRQGGDWSVRRDGRQRPIARLTPEDVECLLAQGMLAPAEGGGYVLTAAAVEEVTAAEAETPVEAGPWIFETAGRRSARASRIGGTGFIHLAEQAREGAGVLTLRQAAAGLKYIADVEQAGRSPGLTMNWHAIPSDRQRRLPKHGAPPRSALEAQRRLRRIRSLLGKRDHSLVWNACVEHMHLNELEERFGLPPRSAGVELAAALETLAEVYEN